MTVHAPNDIPMTKRYMNISSCLNCGQEIARWESDVMKEVLENPEWVKRLLDEHRATCQAAEETEREKEALR